MSNIINSNTALQNSVMTAKETAEYLGISYWLLLKLVKESKIPHSKYGRKIIFRRTTLDSYIDEQERNSITHGQRKVE